MIPRDPFQALPWWDSVVEGSCPTSAGRGSHRGTILFCSIKVWKDVSVLHGVGKKPFHRGGICSPPRHETALLPTLPPAQPLPIWCQQESLLTAIFDWQDQIKWHLAQYLLTKPCLSCCFLPSHQEQTLASTEPSLSVGNTQCLCSTINSQVQWLLRAKKSSKTCFCQ